MTLNVIIGCEESGVGRRAFQAAGHTTWSVDIKPARDGSDWHRQCDLMEVLYNEPDFEYDLGIFHPDCTTVCVAGNRTYAPKGVPSQARLDQINWVVQMAETAKRKCHSIAIENPASVIFPVLRKLGFVIQYIQPWQHGHMEQKKTGLALWNLPPLQETNNVYDEMMQLPRKERERIHFMSPGADRSQKRSESYTGILQAMAQQWGDFVTNHGSELNQTQNM